MVKIHCHNYQYVVMKDKKIVAKFIIVFPYEKNETAVKAVLASEGFANHYLNSKGLLSLKDWNWTCDYIQTTSCDDVQANSIELKGYSIIPFDVTSDAQSKNESLD